MNSGDTDFKESFHHSKHGNYQPITWESVPPLVMWTYFAQQQLKFSQIPLGVKESSSQGAKSQDLFCKWLNEQKNRQIPQSKIENGSGMF